MKHQATGAEYLDRSLGYLEQFVRGEFESFLEDLAGDYHGKVPKALFAQQWSAILQAFGRQERILHSEVSAESDVPVVTVTALHPLRKLNITFTYNTAGAVVCVDLQLLPLDVAPQATDVWEERPVQVGQSEKKLNGMLTLPRGNGRPPVVLLLPGSGPNNMDEMVGTGGNKPFADLAHGLAEAGIASIRYDKRTYAYPEDMALTDVEGEYLEDADAAVKLLLMDERVDGNKIFLLGHSEGGMLGPEVIRRNPSIKGFISFAGTLRRLEDLLLEQTKKMLDHADGLSQEQKRQQLNGIEQAVRQIKTLDPEERETMIMGASAAYWNSLNAIDTPALVRQMDIPILIMQGEEDFQVTTDVDYHLWQEVLAGKQNAQFRLYPGLNHLFMEGGTKAVIDLTVYNHQRHMDAQVIRDVALWVKTVL